MSKTDLESFVKDAANQNISTSTLDNIVSTVKAACTYALPKSKEDLKQKIDAVLSIGEMLGMPQSVVDQVKGFVESDQVLNTLWGAISPMVAQPAAMASLNANQLSLMLAASATDTRAIA